ncbi:MAG: hypothetical protein AAGI28_14080, partial [Pseudomonadota bacterium]
MHVIRLTATALVALTALAAPSTASANGVRFACDTPNGRISELTLPVNATRFVISGTIKPVLFRSDEQWLPTATISLQNPETGNLLSINAIAQSGDAANAMVSVRSISGEDDRTSNVGALALNSVIGFAIIYQAEGDSRIIIGEQNFTATSQLTTNFNLTFNCSTADFVFENISWR